MPKRAIRLSTLKPFNTGEQPMKMTYFSNGKEVPPPEPPKNFKISELIAGIPISHILNEIAKEEAEEDDDSDTYVYTARNGLKFLVPEDAVIIDDL